MICLRRKVNDWSNQVEKWTNVANLWQADATAIRQIATIINALPSANHIAFYAEQGSWWEHITFEFSN